MAVMKRGASWSFAVWIPTSDGAGRRQVARGGYRTKWEALSAERRFLIELERDGVAAQAEVESLLADARRHLSFNSTIFRWHVLRARLAAALGDIEAQRSAAHDALAIVGVDPQLPRHPTVGLAQPAPELVAELEQLARA